MASSIKYRVWLYSYFMAILYGIRSIYSSIILEITATIEPYYIASRVYFYFGLSIRRALYLLLLPALYII